MVYNQKRSFFGTCGVPMEDHYQFEVSFGSSQTTLGSSKKLRYYMGIIWYNWTACSEPKELMIFTMVEKNESYSPKRITMVER